MNIINLYVYENRSMSSDLSKPIMLENLNVDNVQIHIPKEIDGTDMGTWAWWFVYQNARREKFSVPMTLELTTNDDDEAEYVASVSLDYGYTGKHGTVAYALEAIMADGTGNVIGEWHTRTYKHDVIYTLQGNQAEYVETEVDIISALINRVSELITSGAEIAEIAETIENAAATAQEVIDSIPSDYSALSEDVETLKADLEDLDERVEVLEAGDSGSGLTESIKTALMNLVNHVTWDDDDPTGQTYITALYNALYPPIDIVSISAVYTQSGVVYDTDSLNSLKSDLVVTAIMSDQTSQRIVDYSLSGTLTVGTSTITVSYSGKSTTFTVSVTKEWDAEWSYTDGVLPEAKGFSVLMPEEGSPSISLGNDGLNLSLVGSSTGVGYRYDQYDEIGVFEVVFSLTSTRTALYIAQTEDGESGICIRGQYSSNYKGIYLCNAETIGSMTKICDAAQNTDYKVTLVHNNGAGKIYVDDVLKLDNISLASLFYGDYTKVALRNSSNSGTATAKIKSMKVRLGSVGRIE